MNLKVLQIIFSLWIPFMVLLPVYGIPNPEEIKPAMDEGLETVRNRVISDLLEPTINEKEIRHLIQTIQQDGSWPDIDYENVSRTGFEHSDHLDHMLALGRAYQKPNSAFHQNTAVKKAVSTALDFWIKHDFICENWWWNEMGTPGRMIDLLLIMDGGLTENQKKEGLRIAGRANMEGVGARPGGDLIQIAAMMGKQALFKRDREFLEEVLQIMADEVTVTTGRGLKPDLSFHHRTDNVISTLSYGSGYIGSFAYWIVKIKDTEFTLPEEALELLIDYFLDGICQSMVHGKYPDPGAKNRGMTRKGALNPSGPELAENLMQASSYRQAELEEIVKIRRGDIVPELTGNRFFWHSEYFSHQRPHYFASVRMHSSRNHTMEQPHNEEGLKMHHFGDGSNFISLTGKEYYNIYPVWDWQKIPGTTTVQKPEFPHWKEIAKKGQTDFVGGISDGLYGAAAFDFQSAHDPLKARKSWFFFDREYVSLGAGIQSNSPYPVFTTLNQCLLNTDVVVNENHVQEILPKGEHRLDGISWVLHDQVAYLFPSQASVHLKNTMASGNWRQINHQAWSTTEEVNKEVFTLWLDHGQQPENAAYAYIVVPGIQADEIDAYQQKAAITILANSPDIQAVKHAGLNISQIIFYKAGEIAINKDLWLKVDQACMVLIKTKGNKIQKLAVSDPSHRLKTLNLQISSKIKESGDQWTSKWNRNNKSSLIQVTLPQEGYAGQTVVLWSGNQ